VQVREQVKVREQVLVSASRQQSCSAPHTA